MQKQVLKQKNSFMPNALYHGNNNESGQALLFVIVALTIALSVAINVSVRTISSLSRTSRTDTASRVLAAAEGGIERFLRLSLTQMEDAAQNGDCPTGMEEGQGNECIISFEQASDNIVALAHVLVTEYQPTYYPFSISNGEVKEVNLVGYYSPSNQIKICWTPTTKADLMYLTYDSGNDAQIREHGGLYKSNLTPIPPSLYDRSDQNFVEATDAVSDGYAACKTVTVSTSTDLFGLRIRSLGGDSNVAVYGVGADLPLQGYIITSTGALEQGGTVTATKKLSIVKSLPYLPASFDYSLYVAGPLTK